MRLLAQLVPACFVIGFVLSSLQYYIIYAKRRAWNSRFAMMMAAIVAIVAYTVTRLKFPDSRIVPPLFLVLAIIHIAASAYMFGHMPPTEHIDERRRRR